MYAAGMVLPEILKDLLVCPRCHGELHVGPTQLVCDRCQLAYAIEDGVPNMVIADARPLPAGP